MPNINLGFGRCDQKQVAQTGLQTSSLHELPFVMDALHSSYLGYKCLSEVIS